MLHASSSPLPLPSLAHLPRTCHTLTACLALCRGILYALWAGLEEEETPLSSLPLFARISTIARALSRHAARRTRAPRAARAAYIITRCRARIFCTYLAHALARAACFSYAAHYLASSSSRAWRHGVEEQGREDEHHLLAYGAASLCTSYIFLSAYRASSSFCSARHVAHHPHRAHITPHTRARASFIFQAFFSFTAFACGAAGRAFKFCAQARSLIALSFDASSLIMLCAGRRRGRRTTARILSLHLFSCSPLSPRHARHAICAHAFLPLSFMHSPLPHAHSSGRGGAHARLICALFRAFVTHRSFLAHLSSDRFLIIRMFRRALLSHAP